MSIRGIMVKGDFTQDEFNRIVALIRDMDTVPGRLLRIVAMGEETSMEEAREIVAQALPPSPQHEMTEITSLPRHLMMTDAELLLAGSGFCPDCDPASRLHAGPRGGMNQNFACERCGGEFNIAKHGGMVVWGQRTTPMGEPNIERLKSVYGIRL